MKRIELVKLTLRNFKGIKEFTLNADSENVAVYGDNATGKTTLFDGMMWLLFDKDSNNRSDFQIKTVDLQGKELHGLEHEVEAVFLVDGKELTLSKIYKEKWTKKKSAAHKEFTGHTTVLHIDSVPVKQKEFKDKVSEIVDEEVFKLVTNPAYFNEKLKWQERRKILLEVCGDISDQEVIASNKDLKKLSEILDKRSIDDHKKIIASKKKEINKELDMIPVRIDEIQRGLPDTSDMDQDALKKQAEDVDQKIGDKEAEISRIRNGGQVAEKQKELAELQGQLQEIKANHNTDAREAINKLQGDYYNARKERDAVESDLHAAQRKAENTREYIRIAEKKADQLRQKWHEVNSREFEENYVAPHEETCPTCGQDLPPEEIEAARQKAKEDWEKRARAFSVKRSEELEEIRMEGKSHKELADKQKEELQDLEKKVSDLNESSEKANDLMQDLQTKIKDAESAAGKAEDSEVYQKKQDEIQEVKEAIQQLKDSVQDAEQKAYMELQELKADRQQTDQNLSLFSQKDHAKGRIEELSDQERKLAEEFEKMEEELYLAEEFIRSKVNLLEEKINDKFRMARFKLFETQINDGLKETCETLYDGVPYSKGLNNAARINVGLDIIDTLSEHYQFQAPIFVDNAEAVTKLIEIDTQLISLVVSEGDAELRIEAGKQQKEAV